ncbi:MAG: DUF4251 domain-containing protein [Bacteroidaceae bacterium]|nr:DUF4251 domain-containing protein [Bacteroidaceae bacterium]MBQ3538941.1 DUF4251 domain-containing protein [Bacteroidaceae bacterium]MBQ6693750.1 DUF4251 domain-containing protein [Bacteroidaceae bacterium]
MKKFLLLVVLFTLGWQMTAVAQNRKMTKAEREAAWRAERLRKKAAEEAREHAQDSTAFVQAVEALRSGSWALEASNVTFNNGVTRFVTESTNFVSINNGQGTVQTAFDNSNVYSPNGLGGITLEGSVSGERMTQDSNGNIFYSYTVVGPSFSAMVYVTLAVNSNQASARIDPDFSGQSMTMNGYIYPYSTAGIFQGTASYY